MPEESVFELLGKPLNYCPGSTVNDPGVVEAIELWTWYEKGFLPMAGGINDQLNRDLELIMIVEEARSASLLHKDKEE